MKKNEISEEALKVIKAKSFCWEFRLFAIAIDEEVLKNQLEYPILCVLQGTKPPAMPQSQLGHWVIEKLNSTLGCIVDIYDKMPSLHEPAFGPVGKPGNEEKIIAFAQLVASYHKRILQMRGELKKVLDSTYLSHLIDCIDDLFSQTMLNYKNLGLTIRKKIEELEKLPQKSRSKTPVNINIGIAVDNEHVQNILKHIERLCSNEKMGYLYLLTNPVMDGLVKIGMTTRSTHDRAKELSSVTGVPTPFAIVFEVIVSDCQEAEQLLHRTFSERRVSDDREFFKISTTEAIRMMIEIEKKYSIHS